MGGLGLWLRMFGCLSVELPKHHNAYHLCIHTCFISVILNLSSSMSGLQFPGFLPSGSDRLIFVHPIFGMLKWILVHSFITNPSPIVTRCGIIYFFDHRCMAVVNIEMEV